MEGGPPDVLRAQRNKIRVWLQQNAAQLNVRDVWTNPASLPGGNLYTRFAAAHAAAPDKARSGGSEVPTCRGRGDCRR